MPYTLFLTTLIFAPLAFGSVETWSIGLVEVLVFLTGLTCFFQLQGNKQALLRVPGILPLGLLLLWMWLQLIPLPAPLIKQIAPAIFQTYVPILDLGQGSQWIPLTVNQKATLLEALRLTSYGLFYVITVQLLRKSELLVKTVKIIAWLALGIAFLAILQKFTSPREIYWFRPTPPNAGTVGPWVYHNHYAGFMELVFPLVLALFFHYRPSVNYQQSLRARIASVFTAPGANLHFFMGFGVILILASVFIALSRGGTIAITLGLFFLFLRMLKQPGSGKALPLLLFGCALLAVTWLGWDPIIAKFNKTFSETGGLSDGRLLVWRDCGPLIRDFLFTGSGFGTFINVYPQYSTVPTSMVFDHAHNDYIELLTDGGLIGFVLAAWFVLAVLANGYRSLKTRREPYSLLLVMAGLTALFSLLLHSFTDFNMHNGANALYFFFLCGLLVAGGSARLRYRTRPTLLPSATVKWRYGLLLALPLALITLAVQGGIIKARSLYDEISSVYLNPQLPSVRLQKLLATTKASIRLDPLEGRYSYYQGNLYSYLEKQEAAFSSYLQAGRKDPLEGAYLQRLGLFLTEDNNEKAARLMAEGYSRSLNKEALVFTWAEWLLKQGRKQEALVALQKGAAQFPQLAKQLPPLLLGQDFDREEITTVLPPAVGAWVRLGDFAEKLGRMEDAEFYRSHALDFLDREETIKPWYFNQLYWFYKKQKQEDKALTVLRQAIDRLPDYAPFHLYLGDYYRQQKIIYRAKEEYEQALMLEPGNEKIQKRLENLGD